MKALSVDAPIRGDRAIQFNIMVDDVNTIGEQQCYGTAYCTIRSLLAVENGGDVQLPIASEYVK